MGWHCKHCDIRETYKGTKTVTLRICQGKCGSTVCPLHTILIGERHTARIVRQRQCQKERSHVSHHDNLFRYHRRHRHLWCAVRSRPSLAGSAAQGRFGDPVCCRSCWAGHNSCEPYISSHTHTSGGEQVTTTKQQHTPEGAITLAEAKARLGFVHYESLRKLINEGRIQEFRLGRKCWIVESSVETELKRKRSGYGTEEIC